MDEFKELSEFLGTQLEKLNSIKMKKYPELNDCCNVLYDGRECVASVIAIDLDSDTFDVMTSFGAGMWNIPFEKFRYNSTETAIHKYDTIEKIVSQLESCNYESEGGSLINNVAFISLKRMSLSAEGEKV